MNKFFYGDNLDALRRFIRDETVDLCYIDPPLSLPNEINIRVNSDENFAQFELFSRDRI